MKYKNSIALLAIVLLAAGAFLIYYSFNAANATTGASRLSAVQPAQANITKAINITASYIEQVNKSSYLVFYPNLKQAYTYLDKAEGIKNEDPSLAFSTLNMAYSSAQGQLASIDRYEYISLYITIILTAITAIALYLIMKPVNPKSSGNGK